MEEQAVHHPFFFQRGEVNICVFPHLKEFLVIDVRPGAGSAPRTHLFTTDEVLTGEFYRSTEEAFSELLRNAEKTFYELDNLPHQVDDIIRQEALRAIIEKVSQDRESDEIPEVCVFLCTGPALHMSTTQLTYAVQTISGPNSDPQATSYCIQQMERLMHQERRLAKMQKRQQTQEAIAGETHHYFTLWENQNRGR